MPSITVAMKAKIWMPVGMTTALYAVRAGLSVVVVEPRRSPVDKACGEGLMPGALAAD